MIARASELARQHVRQHARVPVYSPGPPALAKINTTPARRGGDNQSVNSARFVRLHRLSPPRSRVCIPRDPHYPAASPLEMTDGHYMDDFRRYDDYMGEPVLASPCAAPAAYARADAPTLAGFDPAAKYDVRFPPQLPSQPLLPQQQPQLVLPQTQPHAVTRFSASLAAPLAAPRAAVLARPPLQASFLWDASLMPAYSKEHPAAAPAWPKRKNTDAIDDARVKPKQPAGPAFGPKTPSLLRQAASAEGTAAPLADHGGPAMAPLAPEDALDRKPRKPGLFLPLDHLSGGAPEAVAARLGEFSAFSAYLDSQVASNYERMRFMEPDLDGLDEPQLAQFLGFEDNVTPLMQPPDTGGNGYFDYKGGDGTSPYMPQPLHTPQPQLQPQPQPRYSQAEPTAPAPPEFLFDTLDFHGLPELAETHFSAPGALLDGGHTPPAFEHVRPQHTRSLSTNSIVSEKARKKGPARGLVCSACGKYISRDMTRHMRIHDERGRFQCVYPKGMCNHKLGNFNRPYDFKKHLLHMHFQFDDPRGRMAHTLTDKLPMTGQCKACKRRYTAHDWLEKHVLLAEERCIYIEEGPRDALAPSHPAGE
jgi:hypothetical protein